jgi:hypothetical protein
MTGPTRRALKTAIKAVRREQDEAAMDKAEQLRALGTLQPVDEMENATSDEPDMQQKLDAHRSTMNRLREQARKKVQVADDRLYEANLALDWLIQQALYAE